MRAELGGELGIIWADPSHLVSLLDDAHLDAVDRSRGAIADEAKNLHKRLHLLDSDAKSYTVRVGDIRTAWGAVSCGVSCMYYCLNNTNQGLG